MIDQNPYIECKLTSGLKCRFYNDRYEVYCGEENGWINICNEKESEEINMSKFKVGDFVRVKSVDEMWKSKKMLHYMVSAK